MAGTMRGAVSSFLVYFIIDINVKHSVKQSKATKAPKGLGRLHV